jgi:hypothetical protein
MRLNEDSLIKKCIFAVAPADIKAVAISVRQKYLERLMEALVDLLENCPHLEFILHWCQVMSRFLLFFDKSLLKCSQLNQTLCCLFMCRKSARLTEAPFSGTTELYCLH